MLAYVCRAVVLFSVGATFSLMFRIHQVQKSEPAHPVLAFPCVETIFHATWWVPTACGIAAALVGLLYPCVDKRLGETLTLQKEWASAMRCTTIFVGINHVCAKFDFPSNLQLMLTLTVMSAALWWTFDRTRGGLGLGLGSALLAMLVTQVLLERGDYNISEKDVSHIRSWLPYVFFSGGITVGNIGRQLAIENRLEMKLKHQ